MSKWTKCLQCERPAVARSRCKAHYERYQQHAKQTQRIKELEEALSLYAELFPKPNIASELLAKTQNPLTPQERSSINEFFWSHFK